MALGGQIEMAKYIKVTRWWIEEYEYEITKDLYCDEGRLLTDEEILKWENDEDIEPGAISFHSVEAMIVIK